MAKILLSPGETLEVGYVDDAGLPTDGGFTIKYTGEKVVISSEWPDYLGRTGILYQESFNKSSDTAEKHSRTENEPKLAHLLVDSAAQVHRVQNFIYASNPDGVNLWSFLVQGGMYDHDNALSPKDIQKVSDTLFSVIVKALGDNRGN